MECYVLVQADVPVVIWACAQQKYSQWVSWSKIECFSSSSKPVYRFSISDRSLEFIDMEMFIFRRCISTNIHLWNCVRIDPINFRAALLNIGYLLFSNEVRMSFYKLFIRVITASWAPRRPDSSKIYIPPFRSWLLGFEWFWMRVFQNGRITSSSSLLPFWKWGLWGEKWFHNKAPCRVHIIEWAHHLP